MYNYRLNGGPWVEELPTGDGTMVDAIRSARASAKDAGSPRFDVGMHAIVRDREGRPVGTEHVILHTEEVAD